MIIILSALVSLLSFRFRGRASLELELIALRHQVTVLRRQRPSRPKLFRADRLLWVWLYRLAAGIDVMVLVKPATVIQWHQAFDSIGDGDQDPAIRDDPRRPWKPVI
jgi:putative transposase